MILINNRKIYPVRLFLTVLVCMLLSQSALAQKPADAHELPTFYAKYGIQFYGITAAEAHYRLTYTETGYRFSQKTNLTGLASMFADDTVSAVSLIDSIDGQLLLKKHTFIQTGKEKNRDEDINIDWDTSKKPAQGKISGVVRGKKISHETDTAIWEVLSFQIPLMIEANKDTNSYPYKALLKGEIDTYDFVLVASKKIEFANKEYDTLHLVRTDSIKDRQLHIWLLPELHNIPVLIENHRKGKVHSKVVMQSVQFNDDKPYQDDLADNDDEL